MHMFQLEILQGCQICQNFEDPPTQSEENACFMIFLVPKLRQIVITILKGVKLHLIRLEILQRFQISKNYENPPTQSEDNTCFMIFLAPKLRQIKPNRNYYIQ